MAAERDYQKKKKSKHSYFNLQASKRTDSLPQHLNWDFTVDRQGRKSKQSSGGGRQLKTAEAQTQRPGPGVRHCWSRLINPPMQ